MPTTAERVARKARPCGAYPCTRTIQPGQTYRRHVGFPGDDGVSGETPWVIDECPACIESGEVGRFDYVQHYYKVPAARDMRVTADGKPGVIVGATGSHLLVRLDGARRATPWHPTWRMQYHPAAA